MTHDTTTHVHDPDPPRCVGRRYPIWTPEEIELLEKLRGQEKRPYKEVATLMNRTAAGVKQRWRWLNITPEERLARADRQYRARNGIVDPTKVRRRRIEEDKTTPDDVSLDRHLRINAPRTLTALFCGDPAPGWSALDRKLQGIGA